MIKKKKKTIFPLNLNLPSHRHSSFMCSCEILTQPGAVWPQPQQSAVTVQRTETLVDILLSLQTEHLQTNILMKERPKGKQVLWIYELWQVIQ